VGDPVALPLGLDAGHEPLGALGHVLRGHGLGRLGAHLVGLLHELLGLLLCVVALALAALLVGLALREVRLPAHRVLVELGPVGVEVEHLRTDGFEQSRVVGDHDDAAGVVLEVVPQPDHRVGVEVVGGLVEQQRVGAPEQDPGELDATALTARERTDLLGHDAVGKPEVRGDPRRLRLGRVAAGRHQLVLGPRVRRHRLLALLVVVRGRHLLRVALEPDEHAVEPSGGEDAVAGRDVEVAGARVLREVADRLPLRLTDPEAGNASPARIFVSVVLPAPLRPTRPIVSPGFTGNDTGLSRSRAPARTSTFVTVSTRTHSSRLARAVEPLPRRPLLSRDGTAGLWCDDGCVWWRCSVMGRGMPKLLSPGRETSPLHLARCRARRRTHASERRCRRRSSMSATRRPPTTERFAQPMTLSRHSRGKRVVAADALDGRRVRLELVLPAPEELEPVAVPDEGVERRKEPYERLGGPPGRRVLVGRPEPLDAVHRGARVTLLGEEQTLDPAVAPLRCAVAEERPELPQRTARHRRVQPDGDVEELGERLVGVEGDTGGPRARTSSCRTPETTRSIPR
jgi:hypothetical protein